MAEINFPFDGVETTFDGPYSSDVFRQFVASISGVGGLDNYGVLFTPNNGANESLDVTATAPASKSVAVQQGAALVNGLWYYNDANPLTTVNIPDNTDGSGFDRIDLLVLRRNTSSETCAPFLIVGTPASSPSAPSPVRSGVIFDIELAEITAQNLFVTITNSDIDTSVRNYAPFIRALRGGTGVNEYELGDMIYAGDTNPDALSKVTLSEFEFPLFDGSNVVGRDSRVFKIINDTTGGSINVGGIGALIPMNDFIDPSGANVVQVSGNQFRLEVGWYEAVSIQLNARGTGATPPIAGLENATTGNYVSYWVGSNLQQFQGISNRGNIFEVTDNTHDYELNVVQVTNWLIEDNTGGTKANYPDTLFGVEITLRRLK